MFNWFKRKKKDKISNIDNIIKNGMSHLMVNTANAVNPKFFTDLVGSDYYNNWKSISEQLRRLYFCEKSYLFYQNKLDSNSPPSIMMEAVDSLHYRLHVPVVIDAENDLNGYNGILSDIEDFIGISIEEFTNDTFKYLTPDDAKTINDVFYSRTIYAPYIPIIKSLKVYS